MWPMYLQSLKLQWPMVKEMHYQENTLFDLATRSRGSRSHKMLPSNLDFMWPKHQQSLMLLHPMVKEKMHLQENTLFELDLRVKVTWNVAQSTLHYVTYAPTEFEVTTSKALGGEAFTRKFNIWPLTLTLGSRSHECCPVPSTSCDLSSYKVWSFVIFALDLGVKVTWNVAQYPQHYGTYSATKF